MRDHKASRVLLLLGAVALFLWGIVGALEGGSDSVGWHTDGVRDTLHTRDAHALRAQLIRPSGLSNSLHSFNVGAARWDSKAGGASLHLDAQRLLASGDWVTATWAGIENPDYDDMIAVYVPAHADITATAPAKFVFAAGADPGHVVNGGGSVRFRLINYRQDMAVVLIRGGLVAPRAVARTVIRVANPNEPLQGHLALTEDPSEMSVQWTSFNASAPAVRWGSSPGALHATAAADSRSYSRADMCGGNAAGQGWVDSGVQHTAVLHGLERGKRYYYSFGDEAWGFSSEASFVAAPEHTATVHILATADVGQGELDGSNKLLPNTQMQPSLNTTRRMAADAATDEYLLAVHNGDISYAEGFSTIWDNFFTQIEPVASRMPYMVVPGNHERDWPGSGALWDVDDSGGECGVVFEARFQMPLRARDEWWYSFDWGPVHFLQYSTEHEFAPGSSQYAFMEADLASVDRARTPWVVVGGHRPIYISSTAGEGPDCDLVVSAALKAALEPLLVEYGVDLTLHGHHHTYQRKTRSSTARSSDRIAPALILMMMMRTCPVEHGTCLGYDAHGHANGPVHLVIGHGGAGLSMNMAHPPPGFLEVSKLWWGYARLHASPEQLHVEVVSDEDGGLADEFKLAKPAGWARAFMARRAARNAARQQRQATQR
ncbi:hypothetical protein FOA52_003150 [Chlamydomonas sp. UWO 241]|nr:hypothetical protein FOA52_003150 [Chlamydomonas sp. UWO 241]